MKKSFLLGLLPLLVLSSCGPTKPTDSNPNGGNSSETTTQTPTSKPNTPDTNSGSYYNGIDAKATGDTLFKQVKSLITSTHKHQTSYNDCRGKDAGGHYHDTDYDPEKPSNLIMFYTHASINASWNSGKTYNREHVWPQSLSNGKWGKSGGGSDMHHIRPTFNPVNSKRGNDKYGDNNKQGAFSHSYNGKSYAAGYSKSGTFEPLDFAKGDVARIILYVHMHYDVPLTNVIEGSTSSALQLMKKWNELDPVDTYEINRNNAVFRIQGNRNPFIDHPEYIEAIW